MGTTGESPTLTVPEHCEVIRFAVEQAGGRIPVVAGTGGNSTHEAIELTVSAAEAGADYSLSVTPYYNKPTQQGLFEHFQAVARAVNLPIILYNVPGRTGCDLFNETVVRLSQIDNIVAIKDATGDVERGAALIEAVPDGFSVFSGDDATALELCAAAAKVMCRSRRTSPPVIWRLCATWHWRRSGKPRRRLMPGYLISINCCSAKRTRFR